MTQIPVSNPEEIINYLDNLNIKNIIEDYFDKKDIEKIGLVDADEFKNIVNEINKKVGVKEMGKKEWDWLLNLIKKNSGDKINKTEAIKLYSKVVLIARDYLYSIPSSNNNITNNTKNIEESTKNIFTLIKEFKFDGDLNKGKSINTLVDLNENIFLASIGEKGKIIINKTNFNVQVYKNDFGFYVCNKMNSYILSAQNSEKKGTLLYSDYELNILEPVEMDDYHKDWISKIIPISINKIATSSGDKTIKIWEFISDKNLKLLNTLNKHTSDIISILKIHDKDILISNGYDKKLIIWDLNTYKINIEVDNICCCFINGMKELPNQRIIVSEENLFIIINYLNGEIIAKINSNITGCCFEIINDYLLIGCFDGSYLELNLKNYNQKNKTIKESNYITSMMKLSNNILIIGLHNGIIKIYKY